jgi:hypothetical protein
MPKRAYGKNRRQQRNRIEAELQQQLTKERSDAEANLAEQVDPTARWLLELERRVGQADYDDIEGWKTIIEELSVQFDDDDVSLATQAQLATLCTRPDINLHAILIRELEFLIGAANGYFAARMDLQKNAFVRRCLFCTLGPPCTPSRPY